MERAWDLKERESILEAKKQRLNAICVGVHSFTPQLKLGQHHAQDRDFVIDTACTARWRSIMQKYMLISRGRHSMRHDATSTGS